MRRWVVAERGVGVTMEGSKGESSGVREVAEDGG